MSLDKDKEYVVFPTPIGPVTIISLAIVCDSLLVHNVKLTCTAAGSAVLLQQCTKCMRTNQAEISVSAFNFLLCDIDCIFICPLGAFQR